SKPPSTRSLTALNWLNFFAADISDGVGPFLAVYLASNLHWQPGHIGAAIAATQLAMVVGQAPAGYIVDNTRRKRMPIVFASIVGGAVALLLPFLTSFAIIICCQVVIGLAASFYIPTLVALASVLAGKRGFDRTIAKNQSYNHAGNVAAAVFTGVVARFTNNAGIFYCMTALAGACMTSALSIREQDAAGSEKSSGGDGSRKGVMRDVLRNKPFLIFLLLTVIFYFSNGAMLPLVGQELARGKPESSTLYLAACIVIAQLVMVPTVWLAGKWAANGRKKLLAAAFVMLAARGLLYTISDNPVYLLSLQILDGATAGMFSVVAIMVVNDLLGGSTRANFAQGALAAALSLGSTLSNLIAGGIVQFSGFPIGFTFLSALALGALVLLWKAMPETVKAGE
ncbi:MAG TPA: MFS transporter, partial [Chthoniobacterales bacterium]|nr:MFS transporter [Chthoniobacterales bacterium]